jgi:hypothetical protein
MHRKGLLAPLPWRRATPLTVLLASVCLAGPVRAQPSRWDASAELNVSQIGSVDEAAVGVGARLSFRVADWLAADGGVIFAPGDLGEPAFSASQTELLFGLRGGPGPDPLGGFVALRAGLVRFAEAPEPLACIEIYPPPVTCVLAQGEDAFAVQLGAGVERLVGGAGLLRLEVGKRMVRLPGPSSDQEGDVHEDDFWSHELRITVSFGLRF